ncbi:MAG: penicillin-binding protein 1C [Burkholderiales bacterium]|nr:penicillin-binding protein 1C [Burkholderiales bacterium]
MGSDPISFLPNGVRPHLAGLCLMAATSLAAAAPPDFAQVKREWRSSEAWVLDRDGRPLQRLRVENKARRFEWVALDAVSPQLKAMLIAAEDQRFEEHDGVDWKAAMSAAAGHLGGSGARGASTLTMQLAAMLDPELQRADDATPRSMAQKLRQARAAMAIEKRWSKAQILEAYLNLVPFRGELTGVSAMSWGLFGKAPHGIDRREAAVAAALVRGPNAHAQRVTRRTCLLLTAQVEQRAKPESGRAAMQQNDSCAGLAAQVEQVLARGYEAFPAQNGAPHAARRILADAPVRGGTRITSTLDADVQAKARTALRARLTELTGRNVEDGAIIVLDNASGEVLAYVGSSGDLSRAAQVDGASAPRQAGSTLKPFLYALAIEERRLTAASVLDDALLKVQTDTGLYIPRNYATSSRGPVSVRASLASSLNIPAVRALAIVGPERFVERLRALGLSTVEESADHYGPSLALGSADVTLIELANAYRTLANGGMTSAVRLRRDVPQPAQRRVASAVASHIVGDMLADRAARAVAFGLASSLETPFWSAVKTGTSKDMRDNWTIGYSTRYTVAVWVGNASGSPMHDVSGVSGAAPLWRDLMLHLHPRGAGAGEPLPPPGVVATRLTYQPAIEAPRREVFMAGTERTLVRLAEPALQSAIVAPVAGSIHALDPDIPPANQRLIFKANAPPGAQWHLNGRPLGEARTTAWFPWPGKHLLRLVGADGQVLDQVDFEVRGARVKTAAR